jgi:excinuclease ABC subunit A
MGPEGGAAGGWLLAEGTPEQLAENPDSHTGRFLAKHRQGASADAA